MGNSHSMLQRVFPDMEETLLDAVALDLEGHEDDDDDELLAEDEDDILEDFQPPRGTPSDYSQQVRIDWTAHVYQCTGDGSWRRKYKMSYAAFVQLCNILSDTINKNFTKSRHGTPCFLELIVAIGLRYLSGVPIDAISDIYKISTGYARECRNDFLAGVILSDTLRITLPQTFNEWDQVRHGFHSVASYGLFHGTAGAMDGFFQPMYKPRITDVGDNVRGYFSGHYNMYGLNVQAACDSKLRFLYFGVLAPGNMGDSVAFDNATELKNAINNLPLGMFFVADAAYPLGERLLVPFTGANRYDQVNDAFNFYLSQMRIRIEMAFGRLTNKWRILRSRINGKVSNVSKILYVCATLHNFVIENENEEQVGVGEVYNYQNMPENIDIIGVNAPNGLEYLPVVPDEELEIIEGYSHTRQAILDTILQENITRPNY